MRAWAGLNSERRIICLWRGQTNTHAHTHTPALLPAVSLLTDSNERGQRIRFVFQPPAVTGKHGSPTFSPRPKRLSGSRPAETQTGSLLGLIWTWALVEVRVISTDTFRPRFCSSAGCWCHLIQSSHAAFKRPQKVGELLFTMMMMMMMSQVSGVAVLSPDHVTDPRCWVQAAQTHSHFSPPRLL